MIWAIQKQSCRGVRLQHGEVFSILNENVLSDHFVHDEVKKFTVADLTIKEKL